MTAPTRHEPYLLPPGSRKFTHGSEKMLLAYIIIAYLLTFICMRALRAMLIFVFYTLLLR